MKFAKFFIVIVIVIITTCSFSSAQTGRRLLTKAQFDSIRVELNNLPDDNQTKQFLAFFHDLVLIDGHKEYVSMNGPAIKSLKNDVGCVAEFTANLNESVTNIEVALSGDQTPVEITETKVEVKSVSAAEDAMNKIKASVAARRAAQK